MNREESEGHMIKHVRCIVPFALRPTVPTMAGLTTLSSRRYLDLARASGPACSWKAFFKE